MERRVRGQDGIEWVCVRALAAVEGDHAPAAAEGGEGTVPVVCSPSREEPTVRLALPEGWEDGLSDEELLHAVAQARIGA
ncbi:hypothetical protein TA3x_005620 [Tundrisphaera sp. TA3]|uniref:hypothetical protein n=1 Tax=Tundrisphaera sp. TA3 TaxID=3435775 RepID=UPI003EBEAFD6